jgi:hypothetical protein
LVTSLLFFVDPCRVTHLYVRNFIEQVKSQKVKTVTHFLHFEFLLLNTFQQYKCATQQKLNENKKFGAQKFFSLTFIALI